MQGVFLDKDSLDLGDIDFSGLESQLSDLRYFPVTAPAQVAERIRDAEVVISNKIPVDASAIRKAKDLKLICVAATGVNNIDLKAAAAQDITVCNARGYGTASVVQHVFSLILALTTRLADYQQAVTAGRWQQTELFCVLFHNSELAGKTLGIVGYGELGQGVASIARAFGMKVLIAQRPGVGTIDRDRIPLKTLLPQVDVLSLHCPLTPETRDLIGAKELALMQRHALLINTARGGIVDEAALVQVLRDRALGGAGVDVLTEEPPVKGNPLLAADIPNLIVTPHCAWGSVESRQRIVQQIVENIRGYLAGQPVRVVV